jgi:ribosomal protein S18 acetylase RimI-like enzyme
MADRIVYAESVAGVTPAQLRGFFVGWSDPPSAEALLRILQGSAHAVLARLGPAGEVVGFITAISDGVSCAYIPHLEVRPDFQGQGVGSELVRRLLGRLGELYMIDLVCDRDLAPFYERLSFRPGTAMVIRHYDRQRCD